MKPNNCHNAQYILIKQLDIATRAHQVPQIKRSTVTIPIFLTIFFGLFFIHRDRKDLVLNHMTPHAIV